MVDAMKALSIAEGIFLTGGILFFVACAVVMTAWAAQVRQVRIWNGWLAWIRDERLAREKKEERKA